MNPIKQRLQIWSRKRVWADMARHAAVTAGHTGAVAFDSSRNVMDFVGIGELPMDALLEDLPGMSFPQMEQAIGRRVNWFLSYNHPLPEEWDFADERLRRRASALWWKIDREENRSARVMEERARLEQILELGSWRQHLANAGAAYAVEGRANDRIRNHLLMAARIASELGDESTAQQRAEEYLGIAHSSGSDVSKARRRDFAIAITITSGSSGLARSDRWPDPLDSDVHVQNLVAAARSVETGDHDALSRALVSARRWQRRTDEDSSQIRLGNDDIPSWVVSTIEQWIDRSGVPLRVDEPKTSVSLTEVSRQSVSNEMQWVDDVLVTDGSSTPSGDPTAPSGELVVEFEESRVVLRRGAESIILIDVGDDEQPLHEYAWSPDAERIALWSDHGPFYCVNADATDLLVLHGHEDGPNLGAVFAGDRMVSWAGDGQLAVWDLATRQLHITIDIDGWADDVFLDSGGHFIAARYADTGWTVFSAESGERVGPTRPATHSRWHPSDPTIALADGSSVWTETYATD